MKARLGLSSHHHLLPPRPTVILNQCYWMNQAVHTVQITSQINVALKFQIPEHVSSRKLSVGTLSSRREADLFWGSLCQRRSPPYLGLTDPSWRPLLILTRKAAPTIPSMMGTHTIPSIAPSHHPALICFIVLVTLWSYLFNLCTSWTVYHRLNILASGKQ